MEKSLGIALFQRRGGRVFLTEEGQNLYTYAQRILDLHREARQEVTGKQTPVTGELLLAASSIPGDYLLPGIVAVFRKQYPDIVVRATQADSSGSKPAATELALLGWWRVVGQEGFQGHGQP